MNHARSKGLLGKGMDGNAGNFTLREFLTVATRADALDITPATGKCNWFAV
jgi:hypothetical protein